MLDEAVKNSCENVYDIEHITYTSVLYNGHRVASFGGTVLKGTVAVGDLIKNAKGEFEIIGMMQGMDGICSASAGEYVAVMTTCPGNSMVYNTPFKLEVVQIIKKGVEQTGTN